MQSTFVENGAFHKQSGRADLVKVLIVDDQYAFARFVKRKLEAQGSFDVRIENDPKQALATARQYLPDIVILDVVMPGVDGSDIRNQFKLEPPFQSVPILFLTGLVTQQETNACSGVIGGEHFVAKSAHTQELISAITYRVNRTYEDGSHPSPSLLASSNEGQDEEETSPDSAPVGGRQLRAFRRGPRARSGRNVEFAWDEEFLARAA
jgi:DNA-binding response OmpR family regulator